MADAHVIDALPEGYEVVVNPRNGSPYLRRKSTERGGSRDAA